MNTHDHNGDTGALACGLRDFFAAADGRGLASAYARIAAQGDTPPPPQDWDETEYAFNRLFVGPGPLAAPPYASIYLDPEPRLMGRSTSQTRAVLEALGLESVWLDSVPDDHIAVELDTALALRAAARQAAALGAEEEAVLNLAAMRRDFVAGHLGRWLPRFADRVLAARPTEPIVAVTRRLERWLEAEIRETQTGPAQFQDGAPRRLSTPQPSTGGHDA